MHENFFGSFGLSESPFSDNPDPRYLVLTPQIRESWRDLTHGIEARKGLMLLTGEAGTGKTMIVNKLLDWLHENKVATAFIFNPHLEVSEMFDFILADFGIPSGSRQRGPALMCLHQWLLERQRADECPILIVDEAQGLSSQLLEEIRVLVNLETPYEKLLQIILVGQPELADTLNRPNLRQLRQRIALRCKTAPLTLAEAHHYVRRRLSFAGAKGKPSFTPEALNAIHLYSSGIPRVMNLLCEHALIRAALAEIDIVPVHIIEEVACKYQFDSVKPVGLTGISADPVSQSAAPIQSLLAEAPMSSNAPLDLASANQADVSIDFNSSPNTLDALYDAHEDTAASVVKNGETGAFHQGSDGLIIMEMPFQPLTTADKAENNSHPDFKPFDASLVNQLLSELELASPSLPSSVSIPRAPNFRRRKRRYTLLVTGWPYDQKIPSLRRAFYRLWSRAREMYWSLVAIPDWQRLESFLARWLRPSIRELIENPPWRPVQYSKLTIPLLRSRFWAQRREVAAAKQLILHCMKASLKWLRQPMGSVKHRHGTGI